MNRIINANPRVANLTGDDAAKWGGAVNNVLTGIGNMFTGWGNRNQNTGTNQGTTVVIPGAPPSNNTALIVGALVVLLVAGVGIWWFVRKK